MTPAKLEDSLSLSPENQRGAYENRHKADLVVFYDANSINFPRKGSSPTPISRLWDLVYELEFTKRLQRTPVLLTGGYAAWFEFIKKRVAKHANGNNVARPYNPKAINGYAQPVPLPERPPSSSTLSGDLASKRANRDLPVYQGAQYAKNITDSVSLTYQLLIANKVSQFGYGPQSMTGETSYTGHQAATRHHTGLTRSSHSPSKSLSSYSSQSTIAAPPQASIHPGPGVRRRSDYIEQHNQTYSGYTSSPPPTSRSSIDYPQAHALAAVPQPPPAAASHGLERYETRPAVVRSGSIRGLDLVAREGDEVRFWNDIVLGLTGLKNLGK